MKRWVYFAFQSCCVAGIVLMTSTWLTASGKREGQLWLVTSREPVLMPALSEVSDIYFEQGRVRVVILHTPYRELPHRIQEILRPVELDEIRIYSPQPIRGEVANPEIEDLLKEVSETDYRLWMEKMTSFEERSVAGLDEKSGSGNSKAVAFFMERFMELGYLPERHCYRTHTYDSECNVVAEIKGGMFPSELVLVVGHMDDVGKEQAGADDNASGSIGLLEMARVLSDYKADTTVRFVATNGEESGLLGSKAYVIWLLEQGQLGKVKFVINMDMIAYNRNGRVDIETDQKFEDEANWYATQASLYTNLIPEVTMPAWGSDHVPFINQGIVSVCTIEDWNDHTSCYHKSCDKLDTLNFKYAVEIIKLNLAVLIQKAGIQLQ